MAIANDIVLNIIKSKYIEKVNSIYGRVQSLNSLCIPFKKEIDKQIRDFIPTFDIADRLHDFNTDIQSYVLNLDKPYSDGSNIVSGVKHAVDIIECLKYDTDFLTSLGVAAYEEISNLIVLPETFINSINNTILDSISVRITLDFPFPEFKIGSKLACINNNLKSMNIPELLISLDTTVSCLAEAFGVDLTTKVDKINSLLNQIYVDVYGAIDYSKMSSLPGEYIENIRSVYRTTSVILNNTKNNINKSLGDIKQNIFVRSN
jgi:hypothetical protein